MGTGGATYAGAGVDIGAGDAAVERMKGLVAGIGGFGGQFPLDTARFTHPVLVASTDGVGTKLMVAQATGRYDTVGIDLVAMCVDDLVCVGAEPLFMLDYIATGKVDPDRIATVVAGVGEGCRLAGCALIGGETAEHPGVMAPDDLDIAGFAVGAVEQGTQLGPERVRRRRRRSSACPRRACAPTATPWPATCCWTASTGVGPWATRPGTGRSVTVADELLRPSVIYTPAVLRVRDALGDGLHACAHITGGGIVGNLPRVLPEDTAAVLERVVVGRAARFSPRSSASARSRRPRWTGSSTAAWAWRWWCGRRAPTTALERAGRGRPALHGHRPRWRPVARAARACVIA